MKPFIVISLSLLLLFIIHNCIGCRCPPTIDLPNFSLFVESDFDGRTSDNEGRLAVGGSLSLVDYSVGGSLSPSNGDRDDVVVFGDVQWIRGSCFHGNVVVHGSASLENVAPIGGSVFQNVPSTSMPVNFNAEFSRLRDISQSLALIPATGNVHDQWGSLTLSAAAFDPNSPSSSLFQVFALDSLQLRLAHRLVISASASTFVVVNINGSDNEFANMGVELIGGIDPTHVLYNFYESSTLSISGVGIRGSILAPTSSVLFNNGNLDGSLYCHLFSGTGETHLFPPIVVVPPCDASCGADCSEVPASSTEWHLSFSGWEYSNVRDETTFHYSIYTDDQCPSTSECESLSHWDLAFLPAFANKVNFDESYTPLMIGEDPTTQYQSLPFTGAIFTVPSEQGSTVGKTIEFPLVLKGKVCYQQVLYLVKGATKCASGLITGPNLLASPDTCVTPPPHDGDCDYSMVSIRVPIVSLCSQSN